jgi:chromosome segregation ATPase
MFDGSPMTPAEIAAKVRVGSRLRAGEVELARLRQRVDAIGDEVRALNSGRTDATSDRTDRALTALDAEKTEIVGRLTPIRREVVELRAARALEIREALAPSISQALGRAIAGVTELRGALHDLGQINSALAQSHAPELFIVAPDIEGLFARLRRLAGKG